jgi:hypothetical protein
MKQRNQCCPECQSKLLARQGDKVICLNFGCNWSIDIRRKEDLNIPALGYLKKEFNG